MYIHIILEAGKSSIRWTLKESGADVDYQAEGAGGAVTPDTRRAST